MVKAKLRKDMAKNRYRPPVMPIGDPAQRRKLPKDARCKMCRKVMTIKKNTSSGIIYIYCRTKNCSNKGILRDVAKFGVTWSLET